MWRVILHNSRRGAQMKWSISYHQTSGCGLSLLSLLFFNDIESKNVDHPVHEQLCDGNQSAGLRVSFVIRALFHNFLMSICLFKDAYITFKLHIVILCDNYINGRHLLQSFILFFSKNLTWYENSDNTTEFSMPKSVENNWNFFGCWKNLKFDFVVQC